jgi:hypothetical protein
MKVENLLISGVHITEDDYNYTGQFILSSSDKSVDVKVEDLNEQDKLLGIKEMFDLEEDTEDIRQHLLDCLVEKSGISSKNVEGENYFKKSVSGKESKEGYSNRA